VTPRSRSAAGGELQGRKRVVVTGASGDVGSAVLATLAAAGYGVTGLCRRVPDSDDPLSTAVRWHSVDLTREDSVPTLRDAVRGADAVVHLAWGFQPSHRLDYLQELGVGGTRRVAEAVVAEGVPHLVHMSSVGAYAPRTGSAPVTEDYPTHGVPSSPYSRHKAAAERLLDGVEARQPGLVVTRLRPGIIGQRSAGSALLRYGVPGLVPAAVLRWSLPLLPLDRRLQIPVVHATDVASAVERVVELRLGGAFNLTSEPPVTVDVLGRALGARPVHVPCSVVRAIVAALWRARLEQLDPGWIDLAYAVPMLDSTRAHEELDWWPRHSAVDVVEEMVDGMRSALSGSSAVLRRRTVVDNLARAWAEGPVHRRFRP
jgi:UDP-glucose 4-epimerase